MNKKIISGTIFLMGLSLLALSSCKDGEATPAKPAVTITEAGNHDAAEGKVTAGGELHLEAEIVAEGLIARIDIEIHQEENGAFEIGESYTEGKYIGVINADFHEHIDIPADAPAGEYHLHFTVTDKLGQTATAEAELIIEPAAPDITVEGLTFGAGHDFPDNKIGYIGTDPVLEATSITAENGIDRISVEMHSEGETAAFEIDTTFTYSGETELTGFHKHIPIPANTPAGDFHLHFKVYDKNGKSMEKSMDIEIKETGITVSNLEIGTDNSAKASDVPVEFEVGATDPLSSIRIRIYKPDAPAVYFYNNTFSDEFAGGNVKTYPFHRHLTATDAIPGEYVLEIRINDNKGAYVLRKEKLTVIAE